MPKYKVDESIYDIPADKVEVFLLKYPNAQLIEDTEPVKTEAVAENVADVTAINEQIATGQSTDLGSEDISLDLEKVNNISQNFQQEDVTDGITTDQQPLDVLEQEDLGLYIDDLIKTRKDYLKTEKKEKYLHCIHYC